MKHGEIPRSIREIQSSLQRGDFSCLELAQAYLEGIAKHENLNAVLTYNEKLALDYARAIDEKLSSGKVLQGLEGVFLLVKDNIHVKGFATTCASKFLRSYQPLEEGGCVKRLKSAGACLFGKTNLDEFAMGSSNENSAFGAVENPVVKGAVPGGSSGGSAAAVAANLCSGALGSDTGGSIRQPGAFCSVVGFKPSYGHVSRRGLVAFASSLDQIGPLAHTVEDAEFLYKAMRSKDPGDATSLEIEELTNQREHSLSGRTVVLVEEFLSEGMEPDVKQAFDSACEALKSLGAKLETRSLPVLKHALETYYLVACAEASSNLARFDSIRYGQSPEEYPDLISKYVKSRHEGFGDEVKRRILLGTFVLSVGYYDAYYKKAQQVRTLVKEQIEDSLKDADFLFLPTAPLKAFQKGSRVDHPVQMYLSDLYTVPANLAGIPAISIPARKGFEGIGLQLMGSYGKDQALLAYASELSSRIGEGSHE